MFTALQLKIALACELLQSVVADLLEEIAAPKRAALAVISAQAKPEQPA
jgi:hypothetical protein